MNGFGTYGGWAGLNRGETEEFNMGFIELYDWENEPIGWLTAEAAMKIIMGEE